jgi:tight adherence protein C
VAGLIVLVLMYSLPRLGLEASANARTRRIEQSLPDAVDMITMCTSAGLPLQHAILRISDELKSSHPDLAFELRIVGRHAETGALSSAVQHFAKRIDVPDVHSVASMVWQAEQQGASVAGAFQAFSDQVRLTRRQRAEEAANKTAFKMLFPLVLCLMPAVYLVLLWPAVLELRNFFRTAKQPGGPLAVPDIQSLAAPPPVPGPAVPTPPPPGARAVPPLRP